MVRKEYFFKTLYIIESVLEIIVILIHKNKIIKTDNN